MNRFEFTLNYGLGQEIIMITILTYISNLNINELKKNKEFL